MRGDDGVGGLVAREAGREAVAAAALRARRCGSTSTAPSERRLTRHVPSGASFSTHDDLGLARAAHDVDQAFDLLERHAVAREVVLA